MNECIWNEEQSYLEYAGYRIHEASIEEEGAHQR